MKKIYFILLIILFPLLSNAQVAKKLSIDISISVIGDRARVFEDQLKSYVQNEMLKIPDVKVSETNPDYSFLIFIFQLPCKCDWFDFHYRAHFVANKNNKRISMESFVAISEGFESYDGIEELAKNLIANLNANYLNTLR